MLKHVELNVQKHHLNANECLNMGNGFMVHQNEKKIKNILFYI